MINYTETCIHASKLNFAIQNHQPVNGNMHLRLVILTSAFTQGLNTQDDHNYA